MLIILCDPCKHANTPSPCIFTNWPHPHLPLDSFLPLVELWLLRHKLLLYSSVLSSWIWIVRNRACFSVFVPVMWESISSLQVSDRFSSWAVSCSSTSTAWTRHSTSLRWLSANTWPEGARWSTSSPPASTLCVAQKARRVSCTVCLRACVCDWKVMVLLLSRPPDMLLDLSDLLQVLISHNASNWNFLSFYC